MSQTRVRLGTKAESLARMTPLLTTGRILPLLYASLRDWRADPERLLDELAEQDWGADPVIVRSSAVTEDSATGSQAGRFRSLPGRRGRRAVAAAVEEVFASYDEERELDQVLIQPQLTDVHASGVAFSCDASSGAPYRVVNWSESDRVDAVTGGRENGLRIAYGSASVPPALAPSPLVGSVWRLLDELIDLTGEDFLEAEFAVSATGVLVLLQVRRLTSVATPVGADRHRTVLAETARLVAQSATDRPRLLSGRAVFGVMPDWNPAELIGLRPRALSLSLYRYLITDQVWARARARYGYRDVRGVPLLVDFSGLPYVDVAASVTSFVPRDVPCPLARRLVEHRLERLVAQPHLHDKLESRIVVSAHCFRTRERLAELADAGIGRAERDLLADSLRRLTDRMVKGPLWEEDLARLDRLRSGGVARVHAPGCGGAVPGCCGPALSDQLQRCREYGTYPFAALARAAFVAMDMLNDLVAEGVLSANDRAAYVSGLALVTSELRRDFTHLGRDAFLKRYGHLRPGTYDILSPRYDEVPEVYFDWSAPPPTGGEPVETEPFRMGPRQMRRLDEIITREGFTFDAARLLDFISAAIRGRERCKFEFTSPLSDVLTGVKLLGERYGCDADDMSHVPLETVASLSGRPERDAGVLHEAVARGHAEYDVTRSLTLPPLLTGEQDVWSFEIPQTQPNFVTRGRVTAPVADLDAGALPDGSIAAIASADPGYDWVFTRGIVGLVTAFGGANSHMAIRALELGIPAVIGAGEALFRQWSRARALEIDAAAGLVRVLP
ncbi:phosphoenolpyruvate synthase [Streptomyces sp. NA02950]|uniref:PEP-utilizing enzyme n=1 Tax=Streptomyces sp. NA02950 TaxID=2742137 RepID=UPI0015902D09|nr:PEP-utilizing enzyme [Streptomyces sp. NA02950]QKV97194.1 phosphoenolpyruvate synthase [Streptomyces sp. NA02950]